MSSRRKSRVAATIAAGLWAWASAAWAESVPAIEAQMQYLPIQGIGHDFGSKSMRGYFVQQSATCLVTLMIIEKSDPEEPLPFSAARLRMTLYPGQVAGLDSEEGRSLNFTCGEDAKTLLVDIGAREPLMELQARTLRRHVVRHY